MIKKLLFTAFLSFTFLGFSQESLEQVYSAPNPFTTDTKIHIKSKTNQTVFFIVKNVLGKTVHQERIKLEKGQNSIPFSKKKLKSGVYIYSIRSKKESVSKRLVIQ